MLRIDQRLQMLATFPEMGARRDDLEPGLRMLVEINWLLLYSYDEGADVVELVAVVDGRRNLPALFGKN